MIVKCKIPFEKLKVLLIESIDVSDNKYNVIVNLINRVYDIGFQDGTESIKNTISREEPKWIPVQAYKTIFDEYRDDIADYINKGTPLPNITDKQISDAFQIAIANYWEEKSKYLTPPPVPSAPPFCCDCSSIKDEWIPVSERLPESAGVYIVAVEINIGFNKRVTDAYYFAYGTWYDDNRINYAREIVDNEVKAWMPLPEHYVESEGKE